MRLTPRASKDEVLGLHDDALKIRLKAPPVDNRANEALVRFLAERLKVGRAEVAITAGWTSRTKTVRVAGLAPEAVLERLGLAQGS